MIRRAEWRPLPRDGERLLVRSIRRVLAITSSFAFAFAAIDFINLDGMLVIVAALYVWHFALGWGARSWPKSPSSELAAHASWPLVEGSFPVRVTYLRHLHKIAYDEAIAAFAEDWLFVDGLRARFGLRLADAHVTFPSEAAVAFDLPHGERVELEAFDAMQAVGDDHGAFRGRFDAALREWASARTVRLTGRTSPFPRFRDSTPLVRTLCQFGFGLALFLYSGSQFAFIDVTGFWLALACSLFGVSLGMIVCGVIKTGRYLRYVRGLPRPLRKGLFRTPPS